jgi:hypothetical protein
MRSLIDALVTNSAVTGLKPVGVTVTYGGSAVCSGTGTATAHIQFVSSSPLGAKVICDGSSTPASQHAIWANGTGSNTRTADYVDIIGFELIASTPTNMCLGFASYGAFDTYQNNYIHDILGQAVAGTGFCSAGGAGIEFVNNGNPPTAAHDSASIGNFIDNIGTGPGGAGSTCAKKAFQKPHAEPGCKRMCRKARPGQKCCTKKK